MKHFEHMACAKPVVGSGIGGLDKFFATYGIGEAVSSMDAKVWGPVILQLINDPQRMKACGANGRKAVLDEFNWIVITKKISDRLFSLNASGIGG